MPGIAQMVVKEGDAIYYVIFPMRIILTTVYNWRVMSS